MVPSRPSSTVDAAPKQTSHAMVGGFSTILQIDSVTDPKVGSPPTNGGGKIVSCVMLAISPAHLGVGVVDLRQI
jgi:hypothetical protein